MVTIVVTGVGAVTPLGHSYKEIIEALRSGRSGISVAEDSAIYELPTYHAGYVRDFVENKETLFKSRLAQFSIQACRAAIKDSGIMPQDYDPIRKALIIGSEPASVDLQQELFNLKQIYDGNQTGDVNETENGLFPEAILSEICKIENIQGRSFFHLGTCSAAAQAIGEGKRFIESGVSDMVLCGGASSRVDPLSMVRLIRVGALAPTTDEDPTKLSMPFDSRRQGFTMAEGAVMFVLETLESALKRNKTPYAILSGYGAALDGHSITDPHPDELGMKISMQRAIQDACLKPEDISYINAHGTSTPKNDFHETRAIRHVFGEHANNLNVSSTKSSHGHLMSAAGAMEFLVSIAALKEQFVPPTLNLNNRDPDCDLDYTPGTAKPMLLKYALSNSFGLGGQNATLIAQRFDHV